MGTTAAQHQLPEAGPTMSRVPEITVAFWMTTALAAGTGETASDFLFNHLPHPVVLAIGIASLVAALMLQFRARRYVPQIYWFAIAIASVSGTMPADVLRVGLGVPTIVSTAIFLAALALIFAAWYWNERTLSIHSICTRRRESFYWAAVVAMFALGTAAADMTAKTLHMGYFSSAVAFGAVIALLLAARKRFRLNAIAAFWLAYVFTRPLGASFTDWLAQPRDESGLGWGTGPVTLVLTIVLIGLVWYRARAAHETVAATAAQKP